MNKLQIMKLHALLAAFIFPVATMFMVTGALYTWGIKGGYDTETYAIDVPQAIQPELAALTALAQTELEALQLAVPSGKPKLKTYGSHFLLEWTGAARDVVLQPTADPLIAELKVKHTSWYRNLVQLHKAKGGTAFKVYAAGLAIALGLLLLSGFIMAWQTPALKRLSLATFGLGLASFVAVVVVS